MPEHVVLAHHRLGVAGLPRGDGEQPAGTHECSPERLDHSAVGGGGSGEVLGERLLVLEGQLGDKRADRVVQTAVCFRKLSDGKTERYVETGEGLDKAGGYTIQGYGSALVRGMCGCYFNVMGLSVPNVVELAQSFGFQLV